MTSATQILIPARLHINVSSKIPTINPPTAQTYGKGSLLSSPACFPKIVAKRATEVAFADKEDEPNKDQQCPHLLVLVEVPLVHL